MVTARTVPADIAALARGKAQRHILTTLHGVCGPRQALAATDLTRGWRGHFGSLMSAGRALATRGLITITEPEPGFGEVYTLAPHTHE
jgi:hypothetical protein